MPKIMRIFYDVVYDAICHLIEDDGFAMASHVALSTLLAVFPFLIFGTTLATFLGADQFSDRAIHLIFDTWPEAIAKPLVDQVIQVLTIPRGGLLTVSVLAKPLVDQVIQVLTIPRGGLLTVSVLAAAYFASNGVEALRISLNRAYRVQETRPWYLTRLASLGFVMIAVVIFAAVSVLLVAVPIALNYARYWFPLFADTLEVVFSWRVYGTLFMLTIGLFVVHLWLPAGRRRVFDVAPGVLVTLLLWLVGALIFAYYLATFANYTATYAGLASVMIVLIFLYMVGVIFIVGAEINAALLKFRVRAIFKNNFLGRGQAKASKPDKVTDIGR